jgi:hypothetical protein
MVKYGFIALVGISCCYLLFSSNRKSNIKQKENPEIIPLEFYETHNIDIQEIMSQLCEKEQWENQQEIDKILSNWEPIVKQNAQFQQPEKPSKSLYSFTINANTFKNSYEALAILAIKLNELGAINRTKRLISCLKDLQEDYVRLFKVWKGPEGSIIVDSPLEINEQVVVAPIEAAWSLKFIFSLCPHGSNAMHILKHFHSMITSIELEHYAKALEAAKEIGLEKLDIEYIAQNFGILSKIIDTNIEVGLLDKESLQK